MVLWRPARNVNLYLPEELLIEIDEAARTLYMSRSEYVRYVLHKSVGGRYPEAVEQAIKENPSRLLDLDNS